MRSRISRLIAATRKPSRYFVAFAMISVSAPLISMAAVAPSVRRYLKAFHSMMTI
jgi:hypothetical protein